MLATSEVVVSAVRKVFLSYWMCHLIDRNALSTAQSGSCLLKPPSLKQTPFGVIYSLCELPYPLTTRPEAKLHHLLYIKSQPKNYLIYKPMTTDIELYTTNCSTCRHGLGVHMRSREPRDDTGGTDVTSYVQGL